MSGKFDELSSDFNEKKLLIDQIPELSSQAQAISAEQLFFQKIDRLSVVPGEDNAFYSIRDSFVSQCEIGKNGNDTAIFKLQSNLSSQLSNLQFSRHFIIDVSAQNDCAVLFNRNSPEENLEFVSESGFDNLVRGGERAVFVLKEVRPNVFHALRMSVRDVTESIGLSDYVAIVYYYVQKDYYGSKVFQVQSGTTMENVFGGAGLSIDSVSSNVEVGKYFNYVVNVSNPTHRIKFSEFKEYEITADTVLSVVYGDHQTFIGTFYGNLSSKDSFGNVSYPAVYEYGPIVFGENISADSRIAYGVLTSNNGDGKYFKVGDRILGWAQGSLNGPLYRHDVGADWSTPENPEDFPSPDFYSITETVQKNLLSLDL